MTRDKDKLAKEDQNNATDKPDKVMMLKAKSTKRNRNQKH